MHILWWIAKRPVSQGSLFGKNCGFLPQFLLSFERLSLDVPFRPFHPFPPFCPFPFNIALPGRGIAF